MISHLLKRAKEIEPQGLHSLQVRAIEDYRDALMDVRDEISECRDPNGSFVYQGVS
jgi:hypothetical protein